MVRLLFPIVLFSFFHSISAKSLDLSEILHILATEHPESKRLLGSKISHKAHADASGILPDPKVGFAYRNYPTKYGYAINDRELNTPTMTGMEISIAQEFPFPGKLGLETKVAHSQHAQSNLIYQEGINFLASELLIQINKSRRVLEKMEINDRIIDLLTAQKSMIDGYYASGNALQTQVLKASIAKTEAISRSIELNTQAKEADASLSYYIMNDKITKKDLKDVDFEGYIEEKHKEFNQLRNQKNDVIRKSPKYLIFVEDEKKLKEQAKLTKYNLAPQTEVFFSYMKRRPQTFALDQGPLDVRLMDVTEYRGDLFSIGMNMKVPLWSAFKWDAITDETEQNARVGEITKEKIEYQLTTDFDKLITQISGLSEQVEILERNLIPQLEKSVNASISLYGPGKVNLQESVLAKVEVLNAKLKLIDLKERKNDSILQLLQLVGKVYRKPDYEFQNESSLTVLGGIQ